MAVTLVDTSVLVDVVIDDPVWYERSAQALTNCSMRGEAVINQIVYGELAPAFQAIEELEQRLSQLTVTKIDLPWDASFLAGHAFRLYRRQGGTRESLLPDLLVGAHAATAGFVVLTRDPRRIRTYFPSVEIIEP